MNYSATLYRDYLISVSCIIIKSNPWCSLVIDIPRWSVKADARRWESSCRSIEYRVTTGYEFYSKCTRKRRGIYEYAVYSSDINFIRDSYFVIVIDSILFFYYTVWYLILFQLHSNNNKNASYPMIFFNNTSNHFLRFRLLFKLIKNWNKNFPIKGIKE